MFTETPCMQGKGTLFCSYFTAEAAATPRLASEWE